MSDGKVPVKIQMVLAPTLPFPAISILGELPANNLRGGYVLIGDIEK